jgi:hypothetical protein
MKNAIKHLLLPAIVLCFTCSFVLAPDFTTKPMDSSSNLTSKPVGGAYLIFAGKTGGKVSKKDLEGQTRLTMNGCPGAKESTIVSFTLEINKGGNITRLQGNSDKLTAEMATKLKSLAAGDSFEFKKVMAHFPNSKDLFEVHTQKFSMA